MAGLRSIPSGPLGAGHERPAPDFSGFGPSGARLEIRIGDFAQPVLLAFLHTRCDGCEEFWQGLRDDSVTGPPSSVSVVIVTKAAEAVSPDEVARVAAGVGRVPVVMSDDAWSAYQVMGYPFFVLVDGVARTVIAETVGFGWPDVLSMIRSAGC